jgi:hypothetical protein
MPRRLLLILSTVALVSGCAGHDPGGAEFGGGGDDRRGRTPNLFISPSGQPFRAEATAPYPIAAWFAAANTAHDGRLTRSEFRADAAAFFKLLDTNHDGVIDGFELQHYERDIAPEINPQIEGLRFGEGMDLTLGDDKGGARGADIGRSPKDGGREEAGDQRPQGAGLYGLLNEPEPVAAADVRFDSRITLDEFLAASDRRFAALDKKGLGYLTLDALPKTPVQRVLERIAARRAKAEKAAKP